MNRGVLYALGAYTAWGLFPAYWKWLHEVTALQLVSHRVLWSCLTLVAFLLLRREWRAFRSAALNPRIVSIYFAAAALISVNWIVFTVAVYAGHVIETSLGYFINPLVNVLLGVVLLRERLRLGQWVALALSTAGVLYLTFNYGAPPWIALTLAFSFGIYGLIKKKAPLNALQGLSLETAILLLPACAYLVYCEQAGQDGFFHLSPLTELLLVGTGLITTVPLLMFASAARSIPLSLLGVLQYIAPTLQFLIGVLLYREPFSHTQLVGFMMVWVALAIFAVDGLLAHRR